MSSKQIMKKVMVLVMSVKKLTDDELLQKFCDSYFLIEAFVRLFGYCEPRIAEKFAIFKVEVLERMSASNGNNK